MSNFKIVKNGYDIQEVDKFIFELNTELESKLHEQKLRISDLKRELQSTNAELNAFKQKNSNISDALVVAVETAKQIENSSKNIYELEIKRIRSLYDKWQKFLDELMSKYPDLQSKYDTKLLLKVFSDDINNILNQNQKSIQQKEAIEVDESFDNSNIGLKILINKMNNINRPASTTKMCSAGNSMPKAERPIVRNSKPSKETYAEYQAATMFKDETERLRKDQIKPISQVKLNKDDVYENLVDKFLSDDDKSFENNAYSKVFMEKEKNDGFNLREAVNPTEDLEEIMRSFSFFPANEESED